MLKSVLLVGASGGLGRYVALELAKHLPSFSRVAFYQNISRPTNESKRAFVSQLQAAGVDIVEAADYADPKPYCGFDCVMIFLGNNALHLQPTIIDTAITAGVRHFYPSEYGADILVGNNRTQRYYKYKITTREHLEARGQELPELGWTYYLLGRLTEWSVIGHFGFDNKNAKARIFGTSQGRQSLIGVEDTARYLVETLKESFKVDHGGHRRTYRVSGRDATYTQIFNILESIRGKRYNVTYLDVEDAMKEEAQAKALGDVDAELSASHKLIQGREGTLLSKPWDNDRFPQMQPKDVEECLRAAFNNENFRQAYGLN